MQFKSMTTLASIIFAVFTATACGQNSTSALNDGHDHQHADAPSVHGMLVFGSDKIWLSHLPMFHKPHDYQVILQVILKKNGQDLKPLYLVDQAQSSAPYYTFVPKKFSMTHLIAGHLMQIEGTLVRGHFERGGVPIAAGVTAEIVEVPVAEKFQPGAVKPATAQYYMLGEDNDIFLAHKIVAKPAEFDQVIKITLGNTSFPVKSGTLISTTLPNEPDQRLKDGMTVAATDDQDSPLVINVGKEIYNETGDLEL